jgi:hypothetical protein
MDLRDRKRNVINPSDILNAAVLVIVNVCGYVALGRRLERVERKLDSKLDVEDHKASVELFHLKLDTKADRA